MSEEESKMEVEASAEAASDEAPPKEAEDESKEAAKEEEEEEEKEEKETPKSPARSPAKSPAKKRQNKDKEEDDGEDGGDDGKVGSYWEVESGGKRQRKSLEHFRVETSSKDKEDTVDKVLSAGSGTPLGEIKTVTEAITGHTIKKADKNDPLKKLSLLLFNKHGTPRETKENLLSFKGMVFESAKNEENWCGRVQKKTMSELKDIMGCLHLERSGTHKELADRLIAFLKKPNKSMADKGMAVAGAKRKSSSKKKASGAKKSAPKKKKASKSKDDVESSESGSESEEEEEEEEEEKPKKKASAPKKKSVDDDSDADEPLVKKGGDDKLAKAITAICSKNDLSTLTLRIVRETLAEEYKMDTVANKDKIKELVNDYVAKNS